MDPDGTEPQLKEMTVGDLIAALSKMSPDTLVVMSRDEEGNGFSPLYDVSPCVYVPERWNDGSFSTSGEIFEGETGEDGEREDNEDGPDGHGPLDMPGAARAVCLWPGN